MSAARPQIALATRTPVDLPGGIESAVRELAPRIAARRPGWDVRLVYAFARVSRWNRVPFLGDLAAAVLLGWKLRGCDVAVVNGAEYAWPRVLLPRTRRKTVVVWHGTRAAEVPALVPVMSPAVKIYRLLEIWLQRAALAAERQIAVSETSAHEIEQAYGAFRRPAVIPNGGTPAATVSRHAAAAERRVVWIGTNAYKKGLDIALAACERARAEFPDLELVVVGVAPPAASWPSWVRAVGRVPQPAALEHLAAATALLGTSRYEGCSVAVIEALALGVPVVAGPTVAWMVGDGGVRVEGFEPASYARALAELLREPARLAAMGRAALRAALRFDWETAADGYVGEIEACFCAA